MTRAAALLAGLSMAALLAGCGEEAADPATAVAARIPVAPLSYGYLPKLGLDVGDVVVDAAWTPAASGGEHVEDEASPRPVEALARMAQDRLVASGGPGRALASITDASLVRAPGQLIGSFTVQVALQGGSGDPGPPVVASVSGTRTLASDDSEQASANALVRQLMDRMNVELEYQVRHQLQEHLGGPTSPVAAPVQTEDLAPPP